MITEESINNDRLIDEVEARQLLYNKNLKEYSNIQAKSKGWEEVCEQLFEVWGQLSPNEKTDAGKLVQKRWKNIRACFARELREQKITKSGQAAKYRRKYKFFDKMLFLIPSMETRQTSGNVDKPDTLREDESGGYESCGEEIARKRKRKDKETREKTKPFEERLLEILKEGKNGDSLPKDKETHFALSLVPLLRAVPENKQLDVQIEILQIFKKFQQNIENPSAAYCQPGTSGIQPNIQKQRISAPTYTILQPRSASSPLPFSNIIYQPVSSPLSLPSTSPQQYTDSSMPLASVKNVTSPNSESGLSLQSYISAYLDTDDESETYDVCQQ